MHELEHDETVRLHSDHLVEPIFNQVCGLNNRAVRIDRKAIKAEHVTGQMPGRDNDLIGPAKPSYDVCMQLPTVNVSDHPCPLAMTSTARIQNLSEAVNARACTACQRLLPDLAFPSKGRQGRAGTCTVCVNDQRRLLAPLPHQVPDVEQIRINNAAALWFGPVRPMLRHAV